MLQEDQNRRGWGWEWGRRRSYYLFRFEGKKAHRWLTYVRGEEKHQGFCFWKDSGSYFSEALLHTEPSRDGGACNETLHHQVAMAGCLPTTAVVVIPVHRLWGRIPAPRTHVLHRLGDNLCGCGCRVDNGLIVGLKSKSLREKQIHI